MGIIFGKKAALYILSAIVILLAVGYFLLTYNRVLNSCDEGYLLVNFQKVTEGQLPHRDFYDDYGPAGYWVGGALFKIFGARIIVFRVFLVILKAAMALLIFLIGRRLLPPAFALIGSFLFVLNWGDPLFPAFTILYAGHFTHFLALLGMLLVLLYAETDHRRWLLGTSVCIGLSSLFKFQIAMIDLIGFALFLCLKEQTKNVEAVGAGVSSDCPGTGQLQFLRALKCLGIVGVMGFYFIYLAWQHLDLPYFFLFLFPFALLLSHMLILEVRTLGDIRSETRRQHWVRLKSLYVELAVLLSAPLVLIMLLVIAYSILGGLRELIYDTFVLPTILRFHHTIVDRRIIAVLTAALTFIVMAAIWLGRMLEGRRPIYRSIYGGIVTSALAALPVAGFMAKLRYRIWHRLATHVFIPAALLTGVYLFLSRWDRKRQLAEYGRFLSFGLVLIFSCQSSLVMFIRSDEAHIVVNSTVIFILVAYLLSELNEAWSGFLPKLKPIPGIVSVAACVVVFSVPSIWGMKILGMPSIGVFDFSADKGAYPEFRLESPRARGLALPIGNPFPLNHPKTVDMNKTVDFIRENTGPGERIFLICDAQVIYFLAERESILSKENYFVYLSNVELIDRSNTGKISDEEMVQNVASSLPRFIVQSPRYADTLHFALTWPKTYEFIKSNYDVAVSFGDYQILRPRHPRLSTNSR